MEGGKDPKMIIGHVALAVVMLLQIVLSFFLFNPDGMEIVRSAGKDLLLLSGILGLLPIYELKKKGKVPKGKSYVKTTRLVETGIYGVVRHPQFVGGILLALSIAMIAQNWVISVLGLMGMAIFYLGLIEGDERGVEKFGKDYREYMERVPRANFIWGLIKAARRSRRKA
jgi:protein-S-isoprenylcysteine O-methyltransferase Ste14